MIRKLCLVGLPLMFRGFKLLQAVIVALFTVAFSVLQSEIRPYKMSLDNTLRVCTEQHTVILAAVAGALLGGDDGVMRAKKSGKNAGSDHLWGLDTEDTVYDFILVSSFAVMVVAPLLITLLAKVVTVQHAMRTELLMSNESVQQFENLTKVFLRLVAFLEAIGVFGDEHLQWDRNEGGQQSGAGTGVRMAYARFQHGLCGVVDKHRLQTYLSVPDAAGHDMPSIAQLQNLLVAHYSRSGMYSVEDRDLFIETVQDSHDRAQLVEVCQSEGLDITATNAAPAPNTAACLDLNDPGVTRPARGAPPPLPAQHLEPRSATTHNPVAGRLALDQEARRAFEVETPTVVRGAPPSLPVQHLQPPPRLGAPPALQSPPSVWHEVYSDEHGYSYWHNTVTNETQWIDPSLDQPQHDQDSSVSDF
jgi:hypothetical protein